MEKDKNKNKEANLNFKQSYLNLENNKTIDNEPMFDQQITNKSLRINIHRKGSIWEKPQ